MFVALQFPFIDVRPFIQTETGRLTLPDWQSLQPDIDFVRSFGLVKRRLRGGVIEWPGEEMYCRALRALRFVNSSAKLPADMSRGAAAALQRIAFRRFLADGAALARFENRVRIPDSTTEGGAPQEQRLHRARAFRPKPGRHRAA